MLRQGASKLEPPRSHVPIQERLNFTPNLANRLGARVSEETRETRECNICHIVGHIAKFCSNKNKGGSNGGGNGGGNGVKTNGGGNGGGGCGGNGGQGGGNGGIGGNELSKGATEHRTPNHNCGSCNIVGHINAQCWTENPARRPPRMQTP